MIGIISTIFIFSCLFVYIILVGKVIGYHVFCPGCRKMWGLKSDDTLGEHGGFRCTKCDYTTFRPPPPRGNWRR